MNFNEYQQKALSTDINGFNGRDKVAHDPAYVDKILSLVGEAGEVAEKYKKIIRDKQGKINEEDRQELAKEIGDVLWYVAVISDYLDFKLDDIVNINVEKLASRKLRNKLSGRGDNR